MRHRVSALTATSLILPFFLSAPSEAKTAFQNWAQGQGVYVSSKDHPPGELQSLLPGGPSYPDDRRGPRFYGNAPPPAYGYGQGYGEPDF